MALVALGEAGAHSLGRAGGLVAVAHVDLDLAAAQAGRDLDLGQRDPVALHLAQALGDLRLGDAEHPQRVAVQRRGALEQLPHGLGRRAPPATSAAARAVGPGRTTTTLPSAGTTSPGRGPDRVERGRPLRHHRLLAVGLAHRLVVEVEATGEAAQDRLRSSPRPPRRGPARGRRSAPPPPRSGRPRSGPSPPEVTIRSIPSPAMKRRAASRSSGRSPTTRMWATSTPSSARRSETQGPLRSAIRPVSTSVPVTTIPALTSLMRRWAVLFRRAGSGRRRRRSSTRSGWTLPGSPLPCRRRASKSPRCRRRR